MKNIWKEFLEGMIEVKNEEMLFPDSKCYLPLFIPAIFELVKYGADVRAIWTFRIEVRQLDFGEGLASTGERPQCVFYAFDLKGSALSVIQLWLNSEPKLPQIQAMCTTRGAILYLRCTILQVGLVSATEDDTRYLKEYELSEQGSGEFVEMFEHCMTSARNKILETFEDLCFQIMKLCDRFDEDSSDPSKCSTTDTFVVRVSEGSSDRKTPTFHLAPEIMGAKVHKRSIRSSGYVGWDLVHGSRLDRKQSFFDALHWQPTPRIYYSSDED